MMVSALGCPSPTTVTPQIEKVTIDGSLGAIEFELVIVGSAFGLSEIWYNVDEATGEAQKPDYTVRIFDTLDQTYSVSSGAQVELRSPTEIRAQVILTTPLEPGVYGVAVTQRGADEPVGILAHAFEVLPGTGADDAGPRPPSDAGATRDRGRVADAGSRDAGLGLDASPPDGGLGPWVAAYLHRREVMLSNPTPDGAPAGLTVRVEVPHAAMVRAGFARADGADLGIYFGGNRLTHQWDDAAMIGTSQLVMVVRLPFTVPPGPYSGPPLILYYDDPAANNPGDEGVFELSERFAVNPAGGWFRSSWAVDCLDRVDRSITAALCILDTGATPSRHTIGTPNLAALQTGLPANVTYELSVHVRGRMTDLGDLVYFSYSDTNNDFVGSRVIPDSQYDLYPPNDSTTFREQNNTERNVRGWKLPDTPPMGWHRSRLRFVPDRTGPSLHFRYISVNGNAAPNTRVELDDLQVRKALQPDFVVQLGPVETR